MKYAPCCQPCFVLVASSLLTASTLNAATYYWDENGSTSGFGTAAGTWAAPTVSLWSTNSNGTATPGASITTGINDDARFGWNGKGLGTGTITVSGTVNIRNMQFDSSTGDILFSGGTINLNNSSTITLNNSASTIDSVLSGAATSLTKTGTGTLTLGGANTYTGSTIINNGSLVLTGASTGTGSIILNAGTLDIGGSGASGSVASTYLILNAGTFNYSRNDSATQSFTNTNINSVITLNAAAGNTLNLGTVTRGAGGYVDFATVGAGTVTADLASNDATGIMAGFTYGDSWAVANGSGVAISGLATYTLSSVAGTTGSNYDGNHIDVDNSAGALDAGIAANSLRFSAAGSNTLTLTGSNTLASGGILVGSGVGSNASTITGGTLAGSASGDLSVIQNNAAGGLIISSVIANNGGATSLTKSGAGQLTLSGNNSFTGGLYLNAGEVVLGNAGALNGSAGSENAVTFGAGSTATLSLNGNSVVIRSLATNSGDPGAPTVQNANASAVTLTVGNSGNATGTFGGNLIDGSGGGALSLVKAGNGTLTLTGTNTYSGGTAISGGTLAYSGDASLGGAGTRNLTFTGNGTLDPTSNFGSSLGTLTVSGGATANFGGDNIAFTSTSGSGDIVHNSGNTTLNLGNASSFTGSIKKIAGSNGGRIQFSSISDAPGAGNLIFGGGSGDSNQRIYISLDGNVGGLTFENRQIEFQSRNPSPSNWSFKTAILENNNNTADNNWVISTNLLNLSDRNTEFSLGGDNAGNNEFAGTIGNSTKGSYYSTQTGELNLIKEGTGKWILSGANTYTGWTLVNQGTLSVSDFTNAGVAGNLGAGSTIQLGGRNILNNRSHVSSGNYNSILEYTGAGHSTDRDILVGSPNAAGGAGDTGGGAILNNGTGALTFTNTAFNAVQTGVTGDRTLTLGGSYSGTNTIQGVIQNNDTANTGYVGLTVSGSVWALNGNNTYTNATNVTAGTLLINGDSSGATGNVTVGSNGTIGGIGTIGGSTTLDGILSPGQSPGILTFSSALTLNTGSTYSFEGGDLTVVGGTLTLGSDWTLALGANLQDGGSITLFQYGALAGGSDLTPIFDYTNLGFTPGGALTLTDAGGSIILEGVSLAAIPEPSALLLFGVAGVGFFLRRRRA